jgi:hypothetical protein
MSSFVCRSFFNLVPHTKNPFIVRKISRLFTALISFAIFFCSCKKDQSSLHNVNTETDNDQLISNAKDYFKNKVQNISTNEKPLEQAGADAKSLLNPIKSLIKKADWDNAYTQIMPTGNIVVVPILFQDHLYRRPFKTSTFINVPLENLCKLIVYIDSKAQFHSEVVSSFPDTTYLQNPMNSFTGVAFIQDWQGNFLRGYSYKPNSDPQQLTLSDSLPGNRELKSNPSTLDVAPTTTCYYEDFYTCAGSVSDPYQYCSFSYTENLGCVTTGGSGGGTNNTLLDYGLISSGSGGSGSTITTVSANTVFFTPKKPVVIAKELSCFTKTNTSAYSITINVEEPGPGNGASATTAPGIGAGHTYITFEQDNADGTKIIRNVGFYPNFNANPKNAVGPSVFGENSNTSVSAQLKIPLSSINFTNAISSAIYQTSYNYDLYIYNCTTAAESILTSANISSLYTFNPLFQGDYPGALGMTIRNLDLKNFGLKNGGVTVVRNVQPANTITPSPRAGSCSTDPPPPPPAQ